MSLQPESVLDSLGVPVIDTAQGLTLTESGSLTRHLDTLTQVFQTALAELQAGHKQALAAKDETIGLLTTRVQDLEQDLEKEVRLLKAPSPESATESANFADSGSSAAEIPNFGNSPANPAPAPTPNPPNLPSRLG